MHSACFQEYIKHNISCPMCKKSLVDPKWFEAQMDAELAAMQMPPEYKDTKMLIICNDCAGMSEVPFHVMGGKCEHCRSYNTARTDSAQDKLRFEKSKSTDS